LWATAHHTRPDGRPTTSQRSMNERSMNERSMSQRSTSQRSTSQGSTNVKVSTYYRREGPTARVLGSPIGDTQTQQSWDTGTGTQKHPPPPLLQLRCEFSRSSHLDAHNNKTLLFDID